ncbi:sugar O-acetyltransferase [Corallincola platygyrae]|uniref:Acetyltransferase n=1 Tax=Corallincola platygyrae TaxID=1193278 RepID=A0ABW4XI12_9GAMM
MTEKEKMLAGQPYDAWDETLLAERMRAKSLCHKFNMADPTDLPARMAIMAELVNLKGKAHFEPNFFCDYGYNITVGDNFYANHNLTILDVCEVVIGDHVLFGPHVMIAGGAHPTDPEQRKHTEYGAPIRIGDNVWVGGNVSIMPGITIGDNCVIGAGSVVTKNIPANSIAVGNPCQVKKSV